MFGVVELGREPDFERYTEWLDASMHAGMEYMAHNQDKREHPTRLLPGATRALIFGMPYYLGDTPDDREAGPLIAQYARLPDYHKHLKRKLKAIQHALEDRNPEIACRVAVDTLPLLERALAARGTLGFIGKNTLFIHPTLGSFYLLGEILSNLDIPPDTKETVTPSRRSKTLGGCGSCKLCQEACPTGALDTAYRLDARKCLSYWTIEHRGPIPKSFWHGVGKYIFGCDICQLVCPYNEAIPAVSTEQVRLGKTVDLYQVATMDQETYVTLFGGTPMTRAKKVGLQRNALIAMFVHNDSRLAQALEQLQGTEDPGIRETIQEIERS